MLTELTITDLDNLRAEIMMGLLNKEGRKEIWKYDIVRNKTASDLAKYDQNHDEIVAASENTNKPYCLIGPGIGNCYFETVAELVSILYWVCGWYLGENAVDPKTGTYKNQTEFLQEYKAKSFPFIPFKK